MITVYYQIQRISSVPKTPRKQTSETLGLIESIFHKNRVPKPNVFGTHFTQWDKSCDYLRPRWEHEYHL